MGTVWRARRSDGRFGGHVAVKLINLSVLDRHGDERFRREGTLLARLEHPHIARLLDAGVTATGQPYLVLEYVDGVRMDRFADERQLEPVERLKLFLQVADAVAHTHASLIVHRDLKPSNILVRTDGHIKLLDFGLGKLLEESSAGQETLSLAGAHLLTPEYAAAEQARGDVVTTAADVYALGVLLYTLLTGRHPTREGSRTPAQHVRAVLERDAVRASDAVADPTPADAAERAARRRRRPSGCAGCIAGISTTCSRRRSKSTRTPLCLGHGAGRRHPSLPEPRTAQSPRSTPNGVRMTRWRTHGRPSSAWRSCWRADRPPRASVTAHTLSFRMWRWRMSTCDGTTMPSSIRDVCSTSREHGN